MNTTLSNKKTDQATLDRSANYVYPRMKKYSDMLERALLPLLFSIFLSSWMSDIDSIAPFARHYEQLLTYMYKILLILYLIMRVIIRIKGRLILKQKGGYQ